MNKSELTDSVAKKANISNAEAGRAVNAILDTITEALKADAPVSISGFGTFVPKNRQPRNGVNPATGERISIDARRGAGFKAGLQLKKALNNGS